MESVDGLYLAYALAVYLDEHSINGLTRASARDLPHWSLGRTGPAGTLDRKPSVLEDDSAAN